MMPLKGVEIYGMANANRGYQDRSLDVGYYSIALETSLSNHFMFSELDYSARCVVGNKISAGVGEPSEPASAGCCCC